MLSIDANLLLYAANEECPEHEPSLAFVADATARSDVAISEFVLVELYLLVRNPAVLKQPLEPGEAADLVAAYRRHPRWMLIGWPGESSAIHDRLWTMAAARTFPRRRIIDQRMALVLQAQGVHEFATANVRDFQGLGFDRVWNPLA